MSQNWTDPSGRHMVGTWWDVIAHPWGTAWAAPSGGWPSPAPAPSPPPAPTPAPPPDATSGLSTVAMVGIVVAGAVAAVWIIKGKGSRR